MTMITINFIGKQSRVVLVIFYLLTFTLLIISMILLESCNKKENIDPNNEQTENEVIETDFPYTIVETQQITFYDNLVETSIPVSGESFYGQDANYTGNETLYQDNGNETISDMVTGLIWQQGYNGEKVSFEEAFEVADTCILGGYGDWRVPSIKELYSLIIFSGIDPSGYEGSDESGLVPFIDTDYFNFRYGLIEEEERIIDAQYVSSTQYVSTTMEGDPTVFGVNFADGRIKGYGMSHPNGSVKTFELKLVRGNVAYGINNFINNDDETISDLATGLMWSQNDCGDALNWKDALLWIQQMNSDNYLGYNDWRIPDVKELQSIVDYTRSPSTSNSAAIDPLFNVSEISNEGGGIDYPFYWSGTTHANMQNGGNAAYVSFGQALGWMQSPFGGEYTLMDVHGAGAQRSDPKSGNPDDYPYGHGPQGDVIRIYNYVRMVRTAN